MAFIKKKETKIRKLWFKYLSSLLHFEVNIWEKYGLGILNFQENFRNLEKFYQKTTRKWHIDRKTMQNGAVLTNFGTATCSVTKTKFTWSPWNMIHLFYMCSFIYVHITLAISTFAPISSSDFLHVIAAGHAEDFQIYILEWPWHLS